MANATHTTALIALLSMPALPGDPLGAVIGSAPRAVIRKAVQQFFPNATPALRLHEHCPDALTVTEVYDLINWVASTAAESEENLVKLLAIHDANTNRLSDALRLAACGGQAAKAVLLLHHGAEIPEGANDEIAECVAERGPPELVDILGDRIDWTTGGTYMPFRKAVGAEMLAKLPKPGAEWEVVMISPAAALTRQVKMTNGSMTFEAKLPIGEILALGAEGSPTAWSVDESPGPCLVVDLDADTVQVGTDTGDSGIRTIWEGRGARQFVEALRVAA